MKGQPTRRQSDAIRGQRSHGERIRAGLQAHLSKLEKRLNDRAEERARKRREAQAEKADELRVHPEWHHEHVGSPYDERRRKLLQRRGDARYNTRHARRQLLEERTRWEPRPSIVPAPELELSTTSNTPYVNPHRNTKPKARLRKELR